MVGSENQLAALIRVLFVIRLVIVGIPSCSISPISSPHWQSFEGRVSYQRTQLCYPDARDSDGVYDVPLGLPPYLRNGSRSRVEIKVKFHEGTVPLSTLLALYRIHLACSLLSV